MDTKNTRDVSYTPSPGLPDTNRERIISFAAERFFREGFSRISIEEIAADLGISKKTIYKHFANKDDLLSHVIRRMMNEAQEGLRRIVESDRNSIEKLAEVVAFLGQLIGRLGKPFQIDLQRHAPRLWTRVEEFRRLRITETFSRLVDQGITEGYVRPDIHRRVFMLAYLHAVENTVHPSVLVN